MPRTISVLISAWPLVLKRGIAHWRLLSSVIIGVLMASTMMAGTVIYFDALRELALKNALGNLTASETDIVVKADRGPTSREEYAKVADVMVKEVNARVAWLLGDSIRGGKTATFFLATPGNESVAGDDNARSYFAFLPRLMEHVTLLPGGRLPNEAAAAPVRGRPLELEAVVPVEAAQLFAVGVGDQLSAVPYWEDAVPYAVVTISGMFERDDPDDAVWHMERAVFDAYTAGSFRTVPFYISEKTYTDVLGGSFRDMDSSYSWLLDVDPGRLSPANASTAVANLDLMKRRLSPLLFSYRQLTSLDKALTEYDRRLFFSKVPMFIILVLIAVVILYYVVTLSSLLIEQQRAEIALLRSRGANSSQVLAVLVMEGATIALVAVVAAPVLAAVVISFMGYTPAFSDLSGGSRMTVSVTRGAYLMSGLGGLLSFAALMVPAVQASRVGVVRHRQEASRPSRQPFFQRYYLDVMLLVVSILLFRELRERESVVTRDLFGGEAVDRILLAVPALILISSAMVLLRLFPLVLDLSSRLMARFLPAGLVLGLWQMARNPTHYARLSLLLILMAGLGIFAASFGGTLERSFVDRAMYATGSDIRLQGVVLNRRGESRPVEESYSQMPGIERVSPAYRGVGSDLSKLLGAFYTMFAVDREEFGDVAYFRDDFAKRSVHDLMSSLEQPDPPQGLLLSEDARALQLTLKSERPQPTVAVTARTRDANGRYFSHCLGTLDTSAWTNMQTNLLRVRNCFGGTSRLRPVRPLTLVSLTVNELNGESRLLAGSLTIDEISVRTSDNQVHVVEPFDDISQWNALRSAPQSVADVFRHSSVAAGGNAGAATFIWAEGSPIVSRGIFHGPPASAVPVLASKSFLRVTGHSLGEEFQVSVGGHRVRIRLVDTFEYFPTLDTLDRRKVYLVADLASLSKVANLETTLGPFGPNEIWLSTDLEDGDRERLIETLAEVPFSSSMLHDRVEALADSQVDPLVKAGWRALLFIAFSAVLVLSILGFLLHAYVSLSSREVQFALMRTIGVSMRQLITLVWLEQVLVIVVGLALGTWMGGRLGEIIMPFLSHDDRGNEVLPPFILEVNWGTLLITYAAMTLVFAVITVGVIWLIHKISLQRVLRLGEM